MSAAITGLAMALLSLATPAEADVIVYSNDFSVGAGSEWSNNSIAASNGEKFLGASANGFGNGTDTLSLSGLAAHDQVTVNFDLYIIQSWDGNGPAGGGPDNYRVTADGTSLLFTNFANYTGAGNTQSYPNPLPPSGPGGTFAPRTGAFELGHLGFGTGDFGDTTYRFSITFAHSSSGLALDFTSFQNQAPGDEGWGLDNVTVSIRPSAVPEPSSLSLCGGGLLGFFSYRRLRARGRDKIFRPRSIARVTDAGDPDEWQG